MKNVILNASFALFVSAAAMSHSEAAPKAGTLPQVTVSYADLDLTREDGARVMLRRLRAAARTVCGGWPVDHSIHAWVAFDVCSKKAMDGAVDDLGSSLVSSLHGVPAERVASRQ